MLKIIKHKNLKNTQIKQKIEKNEATHKFFTAFYNADELSEVIMAP